MNLREKIQFLLDNDFTFNQIGKICECHGTSISKWYNGKSKLSKRMEESIELHIINFCKKLNQVWGDQDENYNK